MRELFLCFNFCVVGVSVLKLLIFPEPLHQIHNTFRVLDNFLCCLTNAGVSYEGRGGMVIIKY